MKKLLIGLTLLASMSSFATEVCLVTERYYTESVTADCSKMSENIEVLKDSTNPDRGMAIAKANVIKKLLEKGYTPISDITYKKN